jgi:hypothetical protein
MHRAISHFANKTVYIIKSWTVRTRTQEEFESFGSASKGWNDSKSVDQLVFKFDVKGNSMIY